MNDQIESRLRTLTRSAAPGECITVKDTDAELPAGQVTVGDDWASATCHADQLLKQLVELADDTPLGLDPAECSTRSVWNAIFAAEVATPGVEHLFGDDAVGWLRAALACLDQAGCSEETVALVQALVHARTPALKDHEG